MKIIKNGIIPTQVFWWVGRQFSCAGCQCVFELEKDDYPTDDSVFLYSCPTCKQTLRLKRPVDPQDNPDPAKIFEELFGNDSVFNDVFGKKKL